MGSRIRCRVCRCRGVGVVRAAAALAAGPGGMRSLRRCGRPVAGGGHRGGIEGDDVAAVADHHPEPVGGQAVPGDDDPARGGDVEQLAADAVADASPAAAASSGGTE